MRGRRRYSGRQFIRERVWKTGDRMELQIYPVFQPPGKRRSKCRPSSEIQQRLNERNSIAKAIRIANANFGEGDLALHLSYADEPCSVEEADRLLSNFLKQLRRLDRKAGIVLKYRRRTEKGVRSGRVHHHLYITGGLDRDEIERLWAHGRCNTRRLQFGKDGIDGLTAYIAGEGKRRDTYRRWSCSRNCVRPQPEEHDGRLTNREADELGEAASMGLGYNVFEAMYPGWECVECGGVKNAWNRGWYVTAVLRRKKGGAIHDDG